MHLGSERRRLLVICSLEKSNTGTLENLGIAVEEDEDGVLGGETPNAQSTEASAITTVLASVATK